MRILVTGAAGAIGAPVARHLMNEGDFVRAFDRAPSPHGHEVVVADLADAETVRVAVRGMDAVVHLGAEPRDGPFPSLIPANILGVFHVFDAMRTEGVRRVVLASSMQVLRRGVQHYTSDPEHRAPGNHYALTKVFAEEMGAMYAAHFGLEVIAARIGFMVRDEAEARVMAERKLFDCYLSRGAWLASVGRRFTRCFPATPCYMQWGRVVASASISRRHDAPSVTNPRTFGPRAYLSIHPLEESFMHNRILGALVGLSLAFAIACASTPRGAQDPALATAKTRSADGAQIFSEQCARCHGDRGQGLAGGPSIMGAGALPEYPNATSGNPQMSDPGQVQTQKLTQVTGAASRDSFRTAADVYRYISTRMPMPTNKAGTLTAEQYWSVLTFMLISHGATVPEDGLSDANAESVQLPR